MHSHVPVFDEEADTISHDVGSDTVQVVVMASASASLDVVELDTTIPLHLIEFADTDVFTGEDATDAVVRSSRPGTNSDWPPPPKPPGVRQLRRAGMYKAITGSSLITIK